MRKSILEDLKQLQALGWKFERYLRWEENWLSHREPLEDVYEAPGEAEAFSDLRWVIEGDRLSQGLTGAQRALLMAVYRAGTWTKAAKSCHLDRAFVKGALQEIKEILYPAAWSMHGDR
jgi:hypothetical protein